MAKKTMVSYLEEQLANQLADYEVGLDWNRKNHSIEIIFRLYAENPETLTLDDVDGVISDEAVIEFEDGILLVDPKKSNYEATDYLAVYPYEGKKGLREGELAAFVSYLKDVLDEGLSDLLDFLNSSAEDSEEIFELKWDRETFKQVVAEKIKTGKEYLPYPSY
ncbi:DUF3013 family protein [Enterococcus sp. 2201sp1_2201st1_B8_2201SCRN_220225]|uniref:DUF3013 family protein n=1 Tax=unclassified Enterococcus TaxID=2608891 RepID=UPI0034A34E63